MHASILGPGSPSEATGYFGNVSSVRNRRKPLPCRSKNNARLVFHSPLEAESDSVPMNLLPGHLENSIRKLIRDAFHSFKFLKFPCSSLFLFLNLQPSLFIEE